MNDHPDPLEYEAQETVEAYLEHDAAPSAVLDCVAVLHHRGEYFEALDLLVTHDRSPRSPRGRHAAAGASRSGVAD